MTSEEKANELFDKYSYLLSSHIFNGTYDVAKQCALIAVDEILRLGKKLPLETLEYYLEVKKEMKTKVLEWAKERDLLHYENHTKQYIKIVEEVGELGSAILKQDESNIIDALGDIQVVLIILAQQLGYDLDYCLESAYNEIKNRKGKTENGTFIKD